MPQGKHIPARKRTLYEAIRTYQSQHGYPPARADLQALIGSRSKASVAHWLDVLQGDGLVTWDKGVARSVRVIAEWPEGEGDGSPA